MIGKATADNMTAKVVGKLKLSLKREKLIWTCCHAAKHVCEILNIFLLLDSFFPHLEWKFIGTEFPVTFLSFGCLYLGNLDIKLDGTFVRSWISE